MISLGILGGSFDPFHRGHLSIAEAALEEIELEKVLLMPAKVSPFKVGRKMASEMDRINMTMIAVAEHPGLEVTTIETDASRVSYTFETMKALEALYPDARLWFIMGSDSMLQLEGWYRGADLLRKYAFVLAPRPGYDMTDVKEKIRYYNTTYGTEVRVLHNELLDISSTVIKALIGEGKSIDHLVPEAVREYIYEHGIYQ